MTCIVGLVEKKRVYIGADSFGSNETCQISRADQKIFRVSGKHDALIGFTGSFRMGQILQYSKGLIGVKAPCTHKYMVTKFIPNVIDIFDKNGLIQKGDLSQYPIEPFLLAFKNKLFQIDSDFQVAESLCGYDAVGSGAVYALGSLASTGEFDIDPVQRVYLAIKASAKFGVGIGAPFHVYDTLSDKETIFES